MFSDVLGVKKFPHQQENPYTSLMCFCSRHEKERHLPVGIEWIRSQMQEEQSYHWNAR